MYSLVDLGLVALFTIAITGSYFAYEKFISIRALSFLRIRKYVLDTIVGVIIGLITILFKFILESFDHDFGIPVYFIVGITFLVIRGVNTSAPALLIPLIYNMFENDFAFINYYIISFYSVIALMYTATSFYTDIKWANLGIVIAVSLMSIIAIPVFGSAFDYGYSRVTYENSILLAPATAIVYYPFRTALRFSISANLLFESVNFVYSRYYRPSLTQSAIGTYISQNRVSKGIFGLFEIKIDDSIPADDATEVTETILKKVESNFNEDATLFSHGANIYGFFIPFKQSVKINEIIDGNKTNHYNDILIDLNDLVNEIDGSYETSSYKVVPVEMRIGTAIYGVQSSSIISLEKSALAALKRIQWSSDNKVINFSFKDYQARLKDSHRLALMDGSIDLNNFSNKYVPLFTKSGNYSKGQYVVVENNSEYELVQDVDELVRINRWKSTFDRYFASESISKNRDVEEILFMQYSYVFSKDFKLEKFMNRLKKMNFPIKRLIIVVSYEDIKNKGSKILRELRHNGFKIGIMNVADYKSAEKYKPHCFILNNSDLKEKIDSNVFKVAPFVSSENEVISCIKNEIDLFGGRAIEINSNVKKPDKQSKIYIEDIMSNLKGES